MAGGKWKEWIQINQPEEETRKVVWLIFLDSMSQLIQQNMQVADA